jgi:hypothetical protein
MLTGTNFAEIESHLQDNAEAIAIIRAAADLCAATAQTAT